ncbi:MAG TPA: ATP-binding protein [Verrucomicrobiae bacterium]|jgi:signal transduction histidine kinase/CheY-like chemotaxis protein
MKRHISSQVYKTALIVWLAFSLCSMILALVSWSQLSTRMTEGRQVNDMRQELNETLSLLLDAETGQRGYLLTGDSQFLTPYHFAQTTLPMDFRQLDDLSRADAGLSKQNSQIQADSNQLLAWLTDVMNTYNTNSARAEKMFATRQGKNLMDKIRNEIAPLDAELDDQLAAIRAQVYERVQVSNVATVAAGFFGLGAGILALWLSYLAAAHHKREHQLVEAKLQAEHSNQEKTIFLANLSHEIRTPMNAIVGFGEILAHEVENPKHRQYLQSIRTSANSLLQLINDILDISKIETGLIELRPEPTDMKEVGEFIRTLFSEPAARKNIKLDYQVREDFPPTIFIDRLRLRQILVNLVGNAIKFTDEGGVEMRISQEKQPNTQITLIVEVQDTGVGIPRDRLDAIFKPFVQSGVHHEKEKQGTGLGLAIVKRLTEALGGTVIVASVLGQGSVFHLRFLNIPVSAKPLPAEIDDESDFNMLCPATILIVDDNQTNCDLLAAMLASSHHRLSFAKNGRQAVEEARESQPDMILMDIRMPGMAGDEALAAIRKIPGLESVPCIAVTASMIEDDEAFLKQQFSGSIRKPFSRRELFNELSRFLPKFVREKTAPPEVVKVEVSPASPELLANLGELLVEPWPAIRDSVAINESKEFALRLGEIGQRWRSQPVIDYSRKLLHDAENYSVADLEKHLEEFSALVEELKTDNK